MNNLSNSKLNLKSLRCPKCLKFFGQMFHGWLISDCTHGVCKDCAKTLSKNSKCFHKDCFAPVIPGKMEKMSENYQGRITEDSIFPLAFKVCSIHPKVKNCFYFDSASPLSPIFLCQNCKKASSKLFIKNLYVFYGSSRIGIGNIKSNFLVIKNLLKQSELSIEQEDILCEFLNSRLFDLVNFGIYDFLQNMSEFRIMNGRPFNRIFERTIERISWFFERLLRNFSRVNAEYIFRQIFHIIQEKSDTIFLFNEEKVIVKNNPLEKSIQNDFENMTEKYPLLFGDWPDEEKTAIHFSQIKIDSTKNELLENNSSIINFFEKNQNRKKMRLQHLKLKKEKSVENLKLLISPSLLITKNDFNWLAEIFPNLKKWDLLMSVTSDKNFRKVFKKSTIGKQKLVFIAKVGNKIAGAFESNFSITSNLEKDIFEDKNSPNSFLFSLSNRRKYALKHSGFEYSSIIRPGIGISFGFNKDFFIGWDFKNKVNYSHLGDCYECFDSDNPYLEMFGQKTFVIDHLEIYEIE